MQYCEFCENFLLPLKKNSNILACKACGNTYTRENDQNSNNGDYIISRKKKKSVKSRDVTVKVTKRTITDEDRRVFEDLTYSD